MKRLLFIVFVFCIVGVSMGQEVINGVYQGSPTSFMYLPTTPPAGGWENSWVKPSYEGSGSGSSFNFINHMGAVTSGNFSHRFIVRGPDSTNSLPNDFCFRLQTGGNSYVNRPTLAEAWNSDLYPGTFVDTVIQMGMPGPNGQNPSGCYAQQIIYSFVPDTINPVLLLNFAFVTEDGQHSYTANPAVEFSVLQHSNNYGSNNNFLPLGYYDATHPYSRFWYRTPSGSSHSPEDPENTPVNATPEYVAVHNNCPIQNSGRPVVTYPYTIVAYDLSAQARSHTAVDFRVRVNSCTSRYHWAYCYFTAKMIPARLQVKYCGGDSLNLSVPWGFVEDSYTWYNGVDAASTTSSNWFDPDDPSDSRVMEGSTKYHPILQPNPAKPYYRCTVESTTGIPFTYEATVNYYDLQPSFTVEPKALTTGKDCDYGIVLHNTSQIGIIRPDGNGGVDTIWEDLEENPDQCTWDFGDGTPEVHGFEPSHIYDQPGTYTITLRITDFERICTSYEVTQQVEILSEYKDEQYSTDSVTTCESKLPYYYRPDLFGYDNVQTQWDMNAIGDRQVNYSYALPQYNIRAWNNCDSIVRVHFDVLTPTVSIEQVGDFCDSAQVLLVANVNHVREDAVEYSWTYMDSVVSTTDEMVAISDGTYMVHIVDRSTECYADANFKIDPCAPNIYLPNCITPTRSSNEGPVQNDYFYLDRFVQRFISDVKFIVYARNGEQVCFYEATKAPTGEFFPLPPYTNLPSDMDGRLVLWDGKVNGKIISGTYVYNLWLVSGGQTFLYKGKITVL